MQFHLDHTPEKPGFEIGHRHKLLLTGSCFSDNIGQLLATHQFNTCINPGGILFNPLSIAQRLSALIHNQAPDEQAVLLRGNIFLSYLHHSSLHAQTKEALLDMIKTETQAAHAFLKATDFLVITFGTAFAYRHLQLNTIVANCHKQPASFFEKKLLEVKVIVSVYARLIQQLQAFNPDLKILFTVSPVKHLKDGLVENNRSKATLLLSVHELISGNKNCFYFPAYELVNDDLRDYRFYKTDLAHPNELAIDYVWQKFSDCYFSAETKALNKTIHQLNTALHHRPLHQNQQEEQKLATHIHKLKEEIIRQFPGIHL